MRKMIKENPRSRTQIELTKNKGKKVFYIYSTRDLYKSLIQPIQGINLNKSLQSPFYIQNQDNKKTKKQKKIINKNS